MKKDLKKVLNDKFNAVELDEMQLSALENQLASIEAKPRQNRKPQYWQVMAATIMLGFLMLFANDAYRDYRSNTLVDAIVLEAVNNHLKLKPLEIESAQLGEVLNYFNKLEFSPIKSAVIAGNPGDRLLGGRYCSIQGIDAAQIRVLSQDGKLSTWYQATLPPGDLKLIPNLGNRKKTVTKFMKGLQVSLWQERGVVFVEVK